MCDFWVFDLTERKWSEIIDENPASVIPTARSGHSATIHDDCMLIFAGIFEVTKEMNDAHIYDFEKKQWCMLFAKQLNIQMSLSSPSPMKQMSYTGSPTRGRRGTRGGSIIFEGSPALAGKATQIGGIASGNMQQPGVDEKAAHKTTGNPDVNLESPTSIKMKNSMLIKHADPSFDAIN